MTRAVRRVELVPAFVLHHRPYRDTSRIVEILTRDQGRLTLFARGVRGGRKGLASLLQPFRPLLVSFSGRGEAAQLTAAEPAVDARFDGTGLPAPHVMSGFYLNELILRLTHRDDAHSSLYEAYVEALAGLVRARAPEAILRVFEKRLLEAAGYGVDLFSDCRTGEAVEPDRYYVFKPAEGLTVAQSDVQGAVSGRALRALAGESFDAEGDLDAARRVMRAALDHCLEGRELATRVVARAVAMRERPR